MPSNQNKECIDLNIGVVAIIVTFNPDHSQLMQLLTLIDIQTSSVVVVDNASSNWDSLRLPPKIKTIRFETNRGIAAAHNAGINYAYMQGAKFALLLDQDSTPANDMVQKLIAAFWKTKNTSNVAAVGSYYGNGGSPFVQLSGLSLTRIECSPTQVVPVDHLISSGSLISISALEKVGYMNEDLFIDYVDTEWSIRAKQAGFTLWGVGNALMTHNLGECTISVLGRKIPLHKPFRYYYIVRNGFSLAFSKNISIQWRLILISRTIKIFILFSIFSKSRLDNLKMMLRGLKDVIFGRKGKL